MRIILLAILTKFYSFRNLMKPNLCKNTLLSALLLRKPHEKENLDFLVKVGNKRRNQYQISIVIRFNSPSDKSIGEIVQSRRDCSALVKQLKIVILQFSKLCPKTHHHHRSRHYVVLHSLVYCHMPPNIFFQFRLEKPHSSSILSLEIHPWSFIPGSA